MEGPRRLEEQEEERIVMAYLVAAIGQAPQQAWHRQQHPHESELKRQQKGHRVAGGGWKKR